MARLSLPNLRGRSGSNRNKSTKAKRLDLRALLTRVRASARRRWQAVAVAGVVIAAATFWFGVRPANDELVTAREDAVVAERRATNLLTEYKTLQSPEGAAAAQERFDRAEAYDTLLPPKLSPVDLLAAVQAIVTDAGLELGASNPVASPAAGPADRLEFYVFNMTVVGEFEQIVSFLEALKSAEPLVTVWTATFKYLPGSQETATPAKVELTTELRFWASALPTLAETKAQIEAATGSSNTGKDADTSNNASTGSSTPTTTVPATPPTLPTTPSTTPPASTPSTAPTTTAP